MTVARLLDDLAEAGIQVWAEAGRLRFRTRSGRLGEEWRRRLEAARDGLLAHFAAESGDGGGSLPPTPLQQAYWIGEKAFYRGAAPAHVYQEFAADALDLDALEAAVRTLIALHPMLSVRVAEDGRQTFAAPAPFAVERHDLARFGAAEAEAALAAFRGSAGHRLPPLSDGPPLLVAAFRLGAGWRVALAFRLFAFDGASVQIFYEDLARLLAGQTPSLPDPDGFRRFLAAARAARPAPRRAEDQAYWLSRLDPLSVSPELPLAGEASPDGRFDRVEGLLSPAEWDRFAAAARSHGLGVNAVLAAVFAATLRRWSATADFALTVLVSGRDAVASGRFIGNCSDTLILECRDQGGESVIAAAAALQDRIYRDLAHNGMSGVEVVRAIQSRRGGGGPPLAPVVFSSFIGLERRDDAVSAPVPGWRLVAGAMSTPQVLLDHQVYLDRGGLAFNWDSSSGCFPGGMVEAMAEYYAALLRTLAHQPQAWRHPPLRPLPEEQTRARRAANTTARGFAGGLLHQGFLDAARRQPESPALIACDREMSYRDVLSAASSVAGALQRAGLCPEDRVGILADKGWRQIVAVLGVLIAGGCYVPLDRRAPPARIGEIAAQAGLRLILRDHGGEEGEGSGPAALDIAAAARSAPIAAPVAVPDDHLAYIIFTSGSTGRPKGVMIEHRAAVNTVQDLCGRFALSPQDRVLGLSELNFDLSVFDIFAILAVGGTLVLPPAADFPDPEAWGALILRHRVSVWNTVPQLLALLLDRAGTAAAAILSRLRLILLSGDWIPLPLAAQVRDLAPRSRLIALGGATEASIWSNWYPVDRIDPRWRSIPYGFPLANQTFDVLDDSLTPCPVWVAGELHIGGAGLARGYVGAPDLTARAFVTDPETGRRLYKTGDLGRYWPDGSLEFLGRRDHQVKIQGMRIELEEVESVLRRHPAIEAALALAVGEGQARRLCAVVIAAAGRTPDEAEIRAHAAEFLPPYMVPVRIRPVSALPLSPNGKVDRAAIARMVEESAAAPEADGPLSPGEAALHPLWAECLERETVPPTADFFALGGNSLRAVLLMTAIRRRFGRRFEPGTIFQHGTLRAMAALLESGTDAPSSPLIPLGQGGGGRRIFAIHPVGGGVACYRVLAAGLAPDHEVFALAARRPGPAAETMRDLALSSLEAIRPMLDHREPVRFVGWSFGGMLAFEMAGLLEAEGYRVWVTMIDSYRSSGGGDLGEDEARDLFRRDLNRMGAEGADLDLDEAFAVFRRNYRALQAYRPGAASFPLLYIQAADRSADVFPGLCPHDDPAMARHCLPGDHFALLDGANAAEIARLLRGLT